MRLGWRLHIGWGWLALAVVGGIVWADETMVFRVDFAHDKADSPPATAAGAPMRPTSQPTRVSGEVHVIASAGNLPQQPLRLTCKEQAQPAPSVIFDLGESGAVSEGVIHIALDAMMESCTDRTDRPGGETKLTVRAYSAANNVMWSLCWLHQAGQTNGALLVQNAGGLDADPGWHQGKSQHIQATFDLGGGKYSVTVNDAVVAKDRAAPNGFPGFRKLEITNGRSLGAGNGGFVAAMDNVTVSIEPAVKPAAGR